MLEVLYRIDGSKRENQDKRRKGDESRSVRWEYILKDSPVKLNVLGFERRFQ